MKLKDFVLPEREITLNHLGKRVMIPESEHTYSPTLAAVHRWFHSDWGPLYLSWENGRLCPFDERVGRMNIKCTAGRRSQCGGLLIKELHIRHLPEVQKRKMLDKVICYPWCHHLGVAWWNVDVDTLLAMPDEPQRVIFFGLREVWKTTGWLDWRRELGLRKAGKRRRDWLKPLPLRAL